jgi:UDP-N-acetylmuramoylalanine-D-glutamate ligase
MGIGNRQIGWSNESNLLWNISKQLDRLIKVTGTNLTTTTTTTSP